MNGDLLRKTTDIPEYNRVDQELVTQTLQTAAGFATKHLLPLNASGDREGCTRHKDNSVTTPKGSKAAYQAYCDLGLTGLTANPAYGGSGLPGYLGTAVSDVAFGANISLMMCPGLTDGAAKILEDFGSEDLKQAYLPSMNSGQASATMCLTEADAGSDLNLLKTEAVPNEDGSFDVSGNKIFITFGDHDLTDNIYHFVLARTPGAPKGTKGVSLFLVPKILGTDQTNNVTCNHIEEKMGLHGSPTCQMNFDNAKGWLIGEPNKGLAAMFKMMNDARLKTSLQGLTLSEIAFQNARAQAQLRIQGKPIKDVVMGNDSAEPVTIGQHGNVKRDLVDMKAVIDGLRFLAHDVSINLDLAKKHPDPAVRKDAEDHVSLLTPVIKVMMTDFGCAATQKNIQLHGGMGYINETGMAQLYPDALIATIYEGTNDIQAMDLVFRKVLDPKSTRIQKFIKNLEDQTQEASKNPALSDCALKMNEALQLFKQSTGEIVNKASKGKFEEVLVDAYDYTNMLGQLAVGGMWLKALQTVTTEDQPSHYRDGFYETKNKLGRHYIENMLLAGMTHHSMRMQGNRAKNVNAFDIGQL